MGPRGRHEICTTRLVGSLSSLPGRGARGRTEPRAPRPGSRRGRLEGRRGQALGRRRARARRVLRLADAAALDEHVVLPGERHRAQRDHQEQVGHVGLRALAVDDVALLGPATDGRSGAVARSGGQQARNTHSQTSKTTCCSRSGNFWTMVTGWPLVRLTPYIGAVVLYLVLQSRDGEPHESLAENDRAERKVRRGYYRAQAGQIQAELARGAAELLR